MAKSLSPRLWALIAVIVYLSGSLAIVGAEYYWVLILHRPSLQWLHWAWYLFIAVTAVRVMAMLKKREVARGDRPYSRDNPLRIATSVPYHFSGGTIFMTKPVGFSVGPNGPGTLFSTGRSVRR